MNLEYGNLVNILRDDNIIHGIKPDDRMKANQKQDEPIRWI